ncbi:thiamine-phosphate kinase [Candidatus Thorarchaeota archaeon]|nr:MAG: thiamine-phosphate kinase [Candidatus Thorarchaeota archaeon]
MKLGDIGERDFLKSIRDYVGHIKGARLGFDDDASDIPLSSEQSLIINVDTFVGKTDWLPGMSAAQVGRKTAVMALSDLAAKGASPLATMLSLCTPDDFDTSEAGELVRGFSQYCIKAGVPFIGGDLGMAQDVILTGVAIGVARPEGIIPRNGAKVGDVIAVTGDFGLTSVAYEILINGREANEELKKKALLAAYKPSINLGLVAALAEKKAVTASMDSSDGLGITLNTIATQSKVAFVIDSLPSAKGVELFARMNMMDEMKFVMLGGEEFLLVLTIPSDKFRAAEDIADARHVSLVEIGRVMEGDSVMYESSEGYVPVPFAGYDNFKEWS